MRKMKDSGVEWIGEIPEEWAIAKTLYVLSMPITDGPHTTPMLYDDGIPFISAEAVSSGKIDFDHKRGYVSENFYKICCLKYIPKRNDIYMVKSGATTGRVAIVDIDTVFTIWSPLAVFRANEMIMHPHYLFYTVQSPSYIQQVEQGWSFGTQQNIGMRVLENLKVCIPPFKEQVHIVDFLDSKCSEIDGLVSDIEKQITTLEQYKRSVITEAVTKGLDPAVPMKDSGVEWIGEIPEHWGLEKLKYKTTIRSESARFSPEDKYIGLENVESYSGRYLPTDTVYDEAVYDIYRQGDVLFGKLRPYLAKVFITEDNGFCTGEFAVIKDYKGYMRFLFYYLLSDGFLKIVNASTYGAKMPRANWDFIKNLPVPAIPFDEERCIADYLEAKCSEIDSAISLKKQQIETLNDYKKSLIYEYVTGKKEIPA